MPLARPKSLHREQQTRITMCLFSVLRVADLSPGRTSYPNLAYGKLGGTKSTFALPGLEPAISSLESTLFYRWSILTSQVLFTIHFNVMGLSLSVSDARPWPTAGGSPSASGTTAARGSSTKCWPGPSSSSSSPSPGSSWVSSGTNSPGILEHELDHKIVDDRVNVSPTLIVFRRTKLLAVCTGLFSVCGCVMAFATEYWHLVLLRMGIAAG